MTVDDVLTEIRGKIRSSIPASIDISEVEFEGALLVIYTKTPDKFANNKDLVKNMAKTLQKRIVVRPDPTVLTDIDIAEKKIRQIIPKEAEITNIYFQPDVGEVTIEALKPGAAIGREGVRQGPHGTEAGPAALLPAHGGDERPPASSHERAPRPLASRTQGAQGSPGQGREAAGPPHAQQRLRRVH